MLSSTSPSTPSSALWCRGRSRPTSPADEQQAPSPAVVPGTVLHSMSAAAARSQSPQLPQSPPNETAISVNLYTESFANAQAVATPLAKSDQTSSPRKNLSPLGSPRTSEDASRFPLWLRTLLIAVVVVGTSLLAWQFLAQQSTVKPHIAVKPATGVVQVAKPASATLLGTSEIAIEAASSLAAVTTDQPHSGVIVANVAASEKFDPLLGVQGDFTDQVSKSDNEAWESDDAVLKLLGSHEPRFVGMVSHLEKSGRRFSKAYLAADGVELRVTKDKGVGVFALQDFKVGDSIPSRRRFEELHFDGCPPEVPYFADCDESLWTPTHMESLPKPNECKIARSFTCATHTDRFVAHETDVFITSYDWDLLINHNASNNVVTRHYLRTYKDAAVTPRQIAHFQVIKPVKAGEELLSNYMEHLSPEDQCDEDETVLECLGSHSSEELPFWKPRRIQRNGAYRLYMPNDD